MHTHITLAALAVALLLLSPTAAAQDLLSLDYPFTGSWNENRSLSPVGSLKIPSGPGILTTTITREPFHRTGMIHATDQIDYRDPDSPEERRVPGLHLGDTIYQRGSIIGSLSGAAEDLPLTTVSRYYADLPDEPVLLVRSLPAYARNTAFQLPERVRFAASWEPILPGRATRGECDLSGTWRTSRGEMNITYAPQKGNAIAYAGSYSGENPGTWDAIMEGPVLTGTWSEPETRAPENAGRFTLTVDDTCCSFTGSWGIGESDTGRSIWSGRRA